MEPDILILTVYFICMIYVVYQMALSVEAELEDQVVLVPEKESLEASVRAQLERQGLAPDIAEVLMLAPPPLKPALALRLVLPEPRTFGPEPEEEVKGQIMVQVWPQGPHPLQPVQGLMVQVLNQTQALQITVDWDRSSITRMNNQILRVIRHTPGMRLDLAVPQVTSEVHPNQLLSTAVTSEDAFGRNPETQVLQITAPLIDVAKLASLPAPVRGYSLDLVVQLTPLNGRGARQITLLLPFRFKVEPLPARAAIPLVNWIAKR
ncbi:MAG: hypothetical protein ACFCVD_21530 [Nodosilinea sp.]